MAINPSEISMEQFLAQWADSIQSLVQGVDTWAGNKMDTNPNFDFTTAKADLNSGLASLETQVSTVIAL